MASQIRPTPMQPKPVKRVKQRKGLRRVSKKLSQRLNVYRMLKVTFLGPARMCDFKGCNAYGIELDVHHTAGRGKNLNRVSTWKAVCRKHHDWIHSHPKEARKLGLLV